MHIENGFSRRLRKVGLMAFCCLALATGWSGGVEAKAGKPETAEFTLANGLQVLVIPDHRAPVVTQMVWYRVGSIDETPGKTGLAHFLEHLMFKGTKKLAPGDFSAIVARNGGEDNAFTSMDYTGFYEQIAVDRLPLVMGMEADRMQNLQLSDQEVMPERKVVLEELGMRVENNPGAILSIRMNKVLYGAHPYGTPTIGWRPEVEKLGTADALAFYHRFYTPNNAILVVVGDVTPAQIKKLVDEKFGPLKPTAQANRRTIPEVAPLTKSTTVEYRDARVTQPVWQRSWLAANYRENEKDAFALQVFSQILGGGSTSRLYRSLVMQDKIAADAGSSYDGSSYYRSEFAIYVVPISEKNIPAINDRVEALAGEIAKDGVKPEELERAKTLLVSSAVYNRDEQMGLANLYGAALATGLTASQVDTWPDGIRAVSAADVKAVAQNYVAGKYAVTGLLLPEKSQ
ncbi:MAG: pitrilysin family protein [Parvibaculaceae bacterium]|nr:pitrilysin family protein [Parvibaculaceae bacterium]